MVMVVKEAHSKVLFTLSDPADESRQVRAIQLADRNGGKLYTKTDIEIDDKGLVTEVSGLLFDSTMEGVEEMVSHVIIGLLPPSGWHPIQNYEELVERQCDIEGLNDDVGERLEDDVGERLEGGSAERPSGAARSRR